MIRLIGDSILHHSGRLFPESHTEAELAILLEQIAIAKHAVQNTGGIGIAANQCAEILHPYRFAIVGVYHDSKEQMGSVSHRYSADGLPEATVLINPEVIDQSNEKQVFTHGCLSVPPGRLRCELQTPERIHLRYLMLDESNKLIPAEKVFTGMEAIILQHELNHILHGDVFIDCALREITADECTRYRSLIESAQSAKDDSIESRYHTPFITVSEGQSRFNEQCLKEALQYNIPDEVILGMRSRC